MFPNKNLIFCSLICFVFSFLLYFNTLNHQFVLDDDVVIVSNKDIKSGIRGLYPIFTENYFHGFSKKKVNSARPVVFSTYALEYQFFGLNPKVFHFNNILFFSICSVILFLFLSRILNNFHFIFPFLITLIFISHPIHSEVVANIKSRDEIFSMLFGILCLHFLLFFHDTKRKIFYLLSHLFFLLAILSKENSFTLIALAPVTLYYFGNWDLKKIITYTWSFLFAGLVLWFAYFSSFGGLQKIDILHNFLLGSKDFFEYSATAFFILFRYIYLFFYPVSLAFNYGFNHFQIVNWINFYAITGLLFYLTILFFSLRNISKKNPIGFSFLFFLLTLSVYSNLIIPAPDPMADRFLYLPSFGLCMALVLVLVKIFRINISQPFNSANLGFFTFFLFVIIMGFSFRTFNRNKAWESNFTLFSTDIKTVPKSARARYFLGTSLLESAPFSKSNSEGETLLSTAIHEFKKAVEIYPSYTEAWNSMGVAHVSMNNLEEALLCYQKATEIDSSFVKAYLNIGNYYIRMKNYKEATLFFKKTISLDPDYTEAYNNLAATFTSMGELDSTILLVENYLIRGPENSELYTTLGAAYYQKGMINQAIIRFSRAFELDSLNLGTLLNLGKCFKEKGDNKNAIYYYSRAEKVNLLKNN